MRFHQSAKHNRRLWDETSEGYLLPVLNTASAPTVGWSYQTWLVGVDKNVFGTAITTVRRLGTGLLRRAAPYPNGRSAGLEAWHKKKAQM